MLVYRGETMGLDEPAASIRLKGLRRGSQDYEYFWLLSQAAGGREAADAAVDSVVPKPLGRGVSLGAPGTWKHDPEAWDRVRLKVGDAIEKSMHRR
jgi:hypothetical protein